MNNVREFMTMEKRAGRSILRMNVVARFTCFDICFHSKIFMCVVYYINLDIPSLILANDHSVEHYSVHLLGYHAKGNSQNLPKRSHNTQDVRSGIGIHGGQRYAKYAHMFCTGNCYLAYFYGTKTKRSGSARLVVQGHSEEQSTLRLQFICRK